MEKLYVAIAAVIGSGKSTLANKLGQALNLPVYYEEVGENSYLNDFYKDMKKYSFPLQIYLLNKRFFQQQQIIWSGKGAIQDRSIYEDSIFAKMLMDSGNIDKRDYETYLSLFHNISNFMRRPNIIIYLHVRPEESLRRIKMRNRIMEQGISLEYLQALYQAYEEFIAEISKIIPVIRVDWNEFQDVDKVIEKVTEEYRKIQIIHEVKWS
jgi:deoxyadenosine kinase